MATMAFNKYFSQFAEDFIQDCATEYEMFGRYEKGTPEYELCSTYQKAIKKMAMFDARCFNIPKEEVTNLIYWRQLDAIRNSIQMVGQAHFSHKTLQGKSCEEIKNMLFERGINWEYLPLPLQRGSCCIKKEEGWVVESVPIFKGEYRKYIDDLIFV